MTLVKILGCVLALGIGLYLGLAGRYKPDPEELDRALGAGGTSRRARRRFTLLGWLRKSEVRSSHIRRRRGTGRFSMVAPESNREKKD